MLAAFLIQMMCITSVSAYVRTDAETARVDEIKAQISTIQLKKKRAVVTLRDGTKLKGSVDEVKESSFIIKDGKTSILKEVEYSDVVRVKSVSKNFLSGKTLLIAVAAVAVVVVLIVVPKPFGRSHVPVCNADQSNAPCIPV